MGRDRSLHLHEGDMGTAIGVPASAITRLTLTVTRPVLAPMRMARDETRSLLAAQLEVMALFTTATLQGPLYRLGLLHPRCVGIKSLRRVER